MQIKKAYKFRLVPTQEQREAFDQFAGSCRFVWNYFRSQREAWYQSGAPETPTQKRDRAVNPNNYVAQANQLPALKKFYPWLKDAPSQSLQQTLKDLDRAYKDFFKKQKGYPSFKKRGTGDSFRFPEPKHFSIDQTKRAIFLPKIGWVKLRLSRTVLGIPKNATISRRGKNWYVSIQVEEEIRLAKAPQSDIGIDLGVSDLAAFSDGTRQKALCFKAIEAAKKRAQRKLSRKTKGSNNWHKERNRLSNIHEKIVNQRQDALHKLSTAISKNHARIVVEELDVKKMSADTGGYQKSQLNRNILAQGWGEFVRQLEYKTAWRQGELIKVDPKYTSQRCHRCDHVDAKNRLGKVFHCRNCGHEEDADTQAAKNILAAGHAVTACGGSAVGLPMNQELGRTAKSSLLELHV